MKKIIFTTTILLIWLYFCQSVGAERTDQKLQIFIVSAKGDVDPGMAAYIKSAVDSIQHQDNMLIILEMDTFGGRVDSALSIVETMTRIPKERTIAFVTHKAISAGALIALSCGQLVMKHNTTIGDCAPIMFSNEGPTMLGEKFQSPLRATFRSIAIRNGYPQVLAEAMVTAEMEVYKLEDANGSVTFMDSRDYNELKDKEKKKFVSKKTVVAKDELLTMNDVEAKDLQFSKMSVDRIEDYLAQSGIHDYDIIQRKQTWSESLVRWIASVSPILLMIGLAGLYMEFKAPGFGLPGIVGCICLGLVFWNQYLVGLANYTELLIILLGIIFLGFEILVLPGFGIAGISGILCITIGMVLTLQDFVLPNPSYPWEMKLFIKNLIWIVSSFGVGLICSLIFFRLIIPKTTRGSYLASTLSDSHAHSTVSQQAKIGNTGIALTDLRPSGKMSIKSDIFDVVSDGEYIQKGSEIVISEIKGNVLVVSRKL
ncbi:MAG: serine protease [Desulfobacterales bacterium]|nr:serine protease [Desulfobacterales bacterium]